MARVEITAQDVTVAGLAPTLTAPTADGDRFDAGRVMLYVANGDDTNMTVTAVTPGTVVGLSITDAAVLVPAGQFRLIGPFPRHAFGRSMGQDNAGQVYVDYSAVDSVTRGLIHL